MNHQQIADRINALDVELVAAQRAARHQAMRQQAAERAALRAQCESMGHVFVDSWHTSVAVGVPRKCACCHLSEDALKQQSVANLQKGA